MSGYSTRPVPGRGILSTKYGIHNGEVYAKRGGFSGAITGAGKAFSRSVPLSDVRNANADGWVIGDVKFETKSGGTELSWTNIWIPKAKASLVMRFKREAEQKAIDSERGTEKRAAQREKLWDIKNNTKFSDKLVVLPQIGGVFDKPLWQRSGAGSYPKQFFVCGSWVNAGDVLCSFEINLPGLFGKTISMPIYSPVSGRVLSSPLNQGMGTNWTQKDKAFQGDLEKWTLCVIQLPEGSSVSQTTLPVYGEFADLCWSHRKELFQSGGFDFSDEHLQSLCKQLKTSDLPVKTADFSFWQEVIDYIDVDLGGLVIPDGPA